MSLPSIGPTLTVIDKHMNLVSLCEKFKKFSNVFTNFIKMTTNTHYLNNMNLYSLEKKHRSSFKILGGDRQTDRQTDKQMIFPGCYPIGSTNLAALHSFA